MPYHIWNERFFFEIFWIPRKIGSVRFKAAALFIRQPRICNWVSVCHHLNLNSKNYGIFVFYRSLNWLQGDVDNAALITSDVRESVKQTHTRKYTHTHTHTHTHARGRNGGPHWYFVNKNKRYLTQNIIYIYIYIYI